MKFFKDKSVKEIMHSIFFLKGWQVLLLDVAGVLAFIYEVTHVGTSPIPEIIVYPFATLCLIWGVCFIIRVGQPLWDWFKSRPFIGRLIKDMDFRTYFFMIISCFLNYVFAVFNIYQGTVQNSDWLRAVAAYYFVLMGTRLWLIFKADKNKRESDIYIKMKREYTSFRNTGVGLWILNMAISAVAVIMIVRDEHFTYPFPLNYGVIVVTFYNLGLALLGMHNYSTMKRPILRANKLMCFPAAVTGLFFCQTMMLATFAGSGVDVSRRIFNSITGSAAFFISLIMAIYMIKLGKKSLARLEELKEHNEETITEKVEEFQKEQTFKKTLSEDVPRIRNKKRDNS